jgi:hypothetical protein
MDLNPIDVGLETMVFQLTSPTLGETLKICVGRAFDENGMDRYNVYEVNKKGDQVVRLRGYYLLDKGRDPYDTDKDFHIKEIGEPTWISPEGVIAPKAPKPPQVSKSEYLVMEDTNTKGDCFYDALLRAKSGNPTVKSTDADIQSERRRIGEMFLRPGAAQNKVVEMYKLYKENADVTKELMRYGKQMQEIPEFAPFYQQLEGVEPEQVSETKNKIMESSDKSLSASDWDVFDELNATDVYPVKEEDKMALELLSEYFDRNTSLSDQDAVSTFVKNVNTMQKWVNELIIVAVQDNDNIQVLPLVAKDSDVTSYTLTGTIIVKSEINDLTKYLMVEYTPLTHFKLISFKDKDALKSLVVYDELPQEMKDKLTENSAYRKALEKMPDVPEVEASVEVPEEEPEVPPVKGPEPPSLVPVAEVPETPKKLTRRKKDEKEKEGRPTVRISNMDDAKQLKEDKLNIPPFTAKEREDLDRMEFKNISAKIKYIIEETGWGKYCNAHFRRAAGNPSQERLNTIIRSDNKDDYQSISGIFALARP